MLLSASWQANTYNRRHQNAHMSAKRGTHDAEEVCFARLHSTVTSLSCRLDAVMYDAEAAQQLEAVVSEEKVHVQRCRETVDDLASHLAGMIAHLFWMSVHISMHIFL